MSVTPAQRRRARPGCNLQGRETAIFALTTSDPAVATVSPTSITFEVVRGRQDRDGDAARRRNGLGDTEPDVQQHRRQLQRRSRRVHGRGDGARRHQHASRRRGHRLHGRRHVRARRRRAAHTGLFGGGRRGRGCVRRATGRLGRWTPTASARPRSRASTPTRRDETASASASYSTVDTLDSRHHARRRHTRPQRRRVEQHGGDGHLDLHRRGHGCGRGRPVSASTEA